MNHAETAAGIAPGAQQTDVYPVEDPNSAIEVGSGSVPVLATPWLVAFMERTAHRLVGTALPAGFTSVGARMDIQHLAPTPLGGRVTITAEVKEVAGRRIHLEIQARDELEKIGESKHERVVVEIDRFLEKVSKKSSAM
jgi:predicted thioesterase